MPGRQDNLLLIVEDDPIYADFIRSSIMQARLPLSLRHVSTLNEALAYVRGDPPWNDRAAHPMPAIILLDLFLSQELGFPVLAFLRENGHLDNEKVRVIIITASDRPEDLQEALRLGAISYLVKSPISTSVTDLVRKFCGP